MIPWRPECIWVQKGVADSPMVANARKHFPEAPVHEFDGPFPLKKLDFATGKRQLVILRHRGSFLHHCPAGTSGLVCCNYLVVNLGTNCPFDCSYCFLQEYLAQSPGLRLFANVEDALAEVDSVLQRHPHRRFRIGTGELIDSLALDFLTEHTRILVPYFAKQTNAVLELKTKSTCVETLVGLPASENVVVAWSLNAPEVIHREEPGTAPLEERLAAARRVQAAGFRVAFHFDPLIAFTGWETAYAKVLQLLAHYVNPERVAWVSLGHLRLSPGLKRIMKERARGLQLLSGELVPAAGGKLRAWRAQRLQMYRALLRWLREWHEPLPRYICMEPADIWEKTFGEVPTDQEVAARLLGASA